MGRGTTRHLAPLGELLERARKDQQLTKRQAAEELGVAARTYYDWLRGQQVSTPDSIDAIVEFTGEHRTAVLEATGWLSAEDGGPA